MTVIFASKKFPLNMMSNPSGLTVPFTIPSMLLILSCQRPVIFPAAIWSCVVPSN